MSNRPNHNTWLYSVALLSSPQSFTDFSLLSPDEVAKLVMKSLSKSWGLDPLPTWLLKKNLDITLPVLLSIVNTSLSARSFPSSLKEAIVTPILKQHNLDCNNFRPVSNTVFLSKIIEKAALCSVSHVVIISTARRRLYWESGAISCLLLTIGGLSSWCCWTCLISLALVVVYENG